MVATAAAVLSLLAHSRGAAAAAARPPPDYALASAWAALPDRPGHADDTPAGVARAAAARVPVFFIHPTTYLALTVGNAPFDASGGVEGRMDVTALRYQASVFNGCCRVFAPRYRQASLGAIISNTPEAYAADDVAYGDVARAFAEFLRRNPQGPFIIASHSQGSIHALRLLQEKVIGTELQRRLVVAYAIGLSLPTRIASLGLPICRDAESTGCIVTWNSVRRGYDDRRRRESAVIWWRGRYQPVGGRPLVCVNPLNWHRNADAPPEDDIGAIYSVGKDTPIPAPIPHLTGAWCKDGLLDVDIPFQERRHFHDILTLTGVYHDFDYSLFYMNLRANASTRIRAWLRSHG
jgi:Protein of unknown function (DUF3089)